MTAAPVHNPIENAAAGFMFRERSRGHYSRGLQRAKAKSPHDPTSLSHRFSRYGEPRPVTVPVDVAGSFVVPVDPAGALVTPGTGNAEFSNSPASVCLWAQRARSARRICSA